MEILPGSIRPLHGHVIVEPDPRIPRVTKSGILLSKPQFEGVPDCGVVISVAKGEKEFTPGEKVYFRQQIPGHQFKGFALTIGGVVYWKIHRDQIMGIVL